MKPKSFTIWEHRPLRIGEKNGDGEIFEANDLQALVEYHGSGSQGVPYFSLGYRCVWFAEYVGVLQVGHLTIEVLPKTEETNSTEWRNKLIQILHKVQGFEVNITGSSSLSLKSNSILEYYFTLFIQETKKLLHQGLVKKYRNIESNQTALKGKLLIGKQISYNCVHRERFFVRHTSYDRDNIFNVLLYKTLHLIQIISSNSLISTSTAALILDFPELKDVTVSEETFDRLYFNRKTERYKPAIEIARLLLLRYHPDLKKGKRDVLALMFDMNLLWEKFVFVTLKKHLKGYSVREQVSKAYWKMDGYRKVTLKPDIKVAKGECQYIIDTKWKVVDGKKPAPADLQQMFAYTKYFSSLHTILLYPGRKTDLIKGFFYRETAEDENYKCSVGIIALDGGDLISKWQNDITLQISKFLAE
jgi:5-methylcytosine-specific restriction enzyme subunit McrC